MVKKRYLKGETNNHFFIVVVFLILIALGIYVSYSIAFSNQKDILKDPIPLEKDIILEEEKTLEPDISIDYLLRLNECRAYQNLSEDSCNLYLDIGENYLEQEKYDFCLYDLKLKEIIDSGQIDRCQEITKLKNYNNYEDWIASICFLALIENEASCVQFSLLNEQGVEINLYEKQQMCTDVFNYFETGSIDLQDPEDIYFIYFIEAIRNQDPVICNSLVADNEFEKSAKIKKCQVLAGYTPDSSFCDDFMKLGEVYP
jgi:hypothetical protein